MSHSSSIDRAAVGRGANGIGASARGSASGPVRLAMVRIFKHYVPIQLLLLAAFEAAILFGSMYLGVSLRFAGHDGSQIGPVYPRAIAFTGVLLGCLTAFGFYMRETPKGNWLYYARFIAAFLAGWVVMTLIFYVHPGLFLGRGAFGLAFLLAFVGIALGRIVFFRLVDQQALQRRVLVLGAGSRAAEVGKLLRANPNGHKFHLVGYLPMKEGGHSVDTSEILSKNGPLLSIIHKYAVDEVVVGIRDRRNGGLCMSDLLECKLEGVIVTDLSTFFERETGHVQLDSLNPSWMVFSDGFQRGSYKIIVKRCFDLAVSLLLLLLTLPIMALTAVLIYLESGMPILYRQERVGECGQVFKILKFRSMRKDAERAGAPQWAKTNDDRVTRVGRVIRLLRIDELPQLLNVLRGDMSFVGPRPERPFFVKELAKHIPFYLNRHTVKPGITGWAQIRYPYGASVDDAMRKLQYDLYYAKNYSVFLDLIILFQTAQVVLFSKGAR